MNRSKFLKNIIKEIKVFIILKQVVSMEARQTYENWISGIGKKEAQD